MLVNAGVSEAAATSFKQTFRHPEAKGGTPTPLAEPCATDGKDLETLKGSVSSDSDDPKEESKGVPLKGDWIICFSRQQLCLHKLVLAGGYRGGTTKTGR